MSPQNLTKKRRSEGVVKRSLHIYNGSDGEERRKKIIKFLVTFPIVIIKIIGMEG